MTDLTAFFDACGKGDVDALREMLTADPGLIRATNPKGHHGGWTGLHSAAQSGHLAAVQLLLERGADPNAREEGDNTTPLHWAAAHGQIDVVRALLDAAADVHGTGDLHELDVIGWATFFHDRHQPPGEPDWALLSLLVERGARHHIISAVATGDLELVRAVVRADPQALNRRMSRFEQGQTALHLAVSSKRDDVLDLLVALGADLDAGDKNGQTAIEMAMLRGDREAMRRLQAAGATTPPPIDASSFTAGMAALAGTTRKIVPMIMVPDVAAALAWYLSIGFTEIASFGEDGTLNFAMVSFGKAEIMLNMHGKQGRHDVSLWFYTDQIDALYKLLKSKQLSAAQAALAGGPAEPGIDFIEELYEPFYGGREFGIRDPNGYELFFMQD